MTALAASALITSAAAQDAPNTVYKLWQPGKRILYVAPDGIVLHDFGHSGTESFGENFFGPVKFRDSDYVKTDVKAVQVPEPVSKYASVSERIEQMTRR